MSTNKPEPSTKISFNSGKMCLSKLLRVNLIYFSSNHFKPAIAESFILDHKPPFSALLKPNSSLLKKSDVPLVIFLKIPILASSLLPNNHCVNGLNIVSTLVIIALYKVIPSLTFSSPTNIFLNGSITFNCIRSFTTPYKDIFFTSSAVRADFIGTKLNLKSYKASLDFSLIILNTDISSTVLSDNASLPALPSSILLNGVIINLCVVSSKVLTNDFSLSSLSVIPSALSPKSNFLKGVIIVLSKRLPTALNIELSLSCLIDIPSALSPSNLRLNGVNIDSFIRKPIKLSMFLFLTSSLVNSSLVLPIIRNLNWSVSFSNLVPKALNKEVFSNSLRCIPSALSPSNFFLNGFITLTVNDFFITPNRPLRSITLSFSSSDIFLPSILLLSGSIIFSLKSNVALSIIVKSSGFILPFIEDLLIRYFFIELPIGLNTFLVKKSLLFSNIFSIGLIKYFSVASSILASRPALILSILNFLTLPSSSLPTRLSTIPRNAFAPLPTAPFFLSLINLSNGLKCFVDSALTTISPLDAITGMLSEVPVPGP